MRVGHDGDLAAVEEHALSGFAMIATRLWWRRGSSLAVLAVAAAATATAVVGPTYAAAASESTLRQVLDTAPAQDSGLHVQTVADVTVDPFGEMARSLPAGFDPAYPTVVRTLALPTAIQGPGGVPRVIGHVVWRDGACRHLVIVAGRCPRGPDELIASQRTVEPTRTIRLGTTVLLDGLPRDEITGDSGNPLPAPAALRVVGLYVPRDVDDRFWFGHNYFGAHPGSGPDGDGPDTVDDVFVDRPAIAAAAAGTTGLAWQDYFLDPTRVTRARTDDVRAAVAAAQRQFPLTGQPTMTTLLPRVLKQADRARSGLDSGTALVTLQLLLLAWLVLFQVVSAASESRATEVAVAKLRGLRPRDVTLFGLAEPVVLVLVATPVGLLAGWLAARALAASVLLPGVAVPVGAWSLVAAAVALLGGILACALASRRILNRSVLEQWRRAEEHVSRGRRVLVVDAAVAVAAVATAVALQRHAGVDHRASSATLLAPALIVLATALVGLRALPAIAAVAAAATRASRHVGMFLAARQVARRATEHRFAALLAVAVGVAVFSVAANGVVRHNQTTWAQMEVGAVRVVPVQPAAGVDVATAVDTADPAGRWAMAAAVWTPVGGSVGVPIEAVDTSRLATVGFYDAGLTRMIPSLSAHTAHPAEVTGDAVRVAMTTTGSFGHPALDVSVSDRPGRTVTIAGPAVRRGATVVTVAVPCQAGCRLVGLALDRDVLDTATMSGTWLVTRVQARHGAHWADVDAQLTRPGAWRAGRRQTTGSDTVAATGTGTEDVFSAEPGGWPSVELADAPRPLPALLTPNATVTPETPPTVNDLAGAPVALTRVATVERVPRLMHTGGLVDLAAARETLPAFEQLSRQQVWLGRNAPSDAVVRLRKAGLAVGTADSVRSDVQSLRQQGPALALQLFLFASFACSALALAATALAMAAAARRRTFELAALLAIGVRRSALMRASVAEQLALLGAGLVLGIVPALVAAAVALPKIPEFVDDAPIPLSYSPDARTLLGYVAALCVVTLIVAVTGAATLVRAAVPSRLRESAP